MCVFSGARLALNSFLWTTKREHIGLSWLMSIWKEWIYIQRMTWPANFPDLNPIEHAWDALGRGIAMRQPPPRTILELKITLMEEWEGLPQALLNSLINSMHTRWGLVIGMTIHNIG